MTQNDALLQKLIRKKEYLTGTYLYTAIFSSLVFVCLAFPESLQFGTGPQKIATKNCTMRTSIRAAFISDGKEFQLQRMPVLC